MSAVTLQLGRPNADNVESGSLDTEGVCEDVNILVDDRLTLEERRIFVVDVSPKMDVNAE